MRPIRLKLYYNYLNNFDFVDKNLQVSKSIIFIPKLHALIIQSKPNEYQLLKNIVVKGLVLEAFTNQRFFIKKIEKALSKSLFFKSTLRKRNLLLFLENCLNTMFLNEHMSTLSSVSMENKFHFYLNNNLINYFVSASDQFRYSIQISESFVLLKKANRWSFYLIPIKNEL